MKKHGGGGIFCSASSCGFVWQVRVLVWIPEGGEDRRPEKGLYGFKFGVRCIKGGVGGASALTLG